MMPLLIWIAIIGLTIAAWCFIYNVFKKRKYGKLAFWINVFLFTVYTGGAAILIPQQKDWGGLGIVIMWAVLFTVHSFTLFIIAIALRREKKKENGF